MNVVDSVLYRLLNLERSYSQCGEDLILRMLFNRMRRETISYLDIGTNHPVRHNNTWLFYFGGSRGVCVEPNPAMCDIIRKYRPEDTCLNVGIGVEEGSTNFYVMSSHTLSTFSAEDAAKLHAEGTHKIVQTLPIDVRTVNGIITQHFDGPPDLVSIDVEGWNEQIVESLDLSSVRPFCFCVETVEFAEDGMPRRLDAIFDHFSVNDYSVYADTHLNTIFIDDRTPGLKHV